MSNRYIHLEELLCGDGFRRALRRALRSGTALYGLRYSLEVEPDDVTWDVCPLTDEEDVACWLSIDPRGVIAHNPGEVEALRERLEKAAKSSLGDFSPSLPGFEPIRLPWQQMTSEYVEAINRLEAWAETPVCLGDLDPHMKVQHKPFSCYYPLAPLAESMMGRIDDACVRLSEAVGSTLVYTARRTEAQTVPDVWGPDSVKTPYEWAARATIQIEGTDEIWITDLALTHAFYEEVSSYRDPVEVAIQNARSKWALSLPEVTRRICAIRLLNRLHILHDEDVMPLIREQSAFRARVEERARAERKAVLQARD